MRIQHKVVVRLPTAESARSFHDWLEDNANEIEKSHEDILIGRLSIETDTMPKAPDTVCEVCGSQDGEHYAEECFK